MDYLASNLWLIITTVLLPLWFIISTAYPGGAPDLACESMFPSGHFSPAQRSSPPYKVVLPKTTYQPGETIKVDIYGDRTSFKGLFVQPRHVGCHVNATKTIGVFTAPDSRLQTRHCFGIVHSAVTHKSNEMKGSVSFYWTAPVVPSGHLVIRATMIKDKTTFWTEVDSPPLIDLHSKDMPFCISHKHNEKFKFNHTKINYEAKTFKGNSSSRSSSGHFFISWMLLSVCIVVDCLVNHRFMAACIH